ncbi:3'-5' exonuclease [Spongiactinospora sp. TRM90649]|uniref:3'-5' exonuclease n=1 Tax=Spongiactinospora sp. TRM90649 TaxID=3031114 RepID=UPI0023F8D4EC|nr:3'-5' exonuclease [Spongiactinospora sp. TRM90649]MDF5759067.1 3'-5' exonuclease [Spongiactinospora sp. TRM90649]
MHDQPWTAADIVALDLEGSGAQDRQDEAILEIAAVPLAHGRPDMGAAWDSVINPGRRIHPRPWISPGLTGDALTGAPTLDEVRDIIAEKLNGHILVGHNIGVDWRLLHRRLPDVRPAGLLDTARLARRLRPGAQRWNLSGLLDEYGLYGEVETHVPGGRPHRALWDAVGAALLLADLAHRRSAKTPTMLGALIAVAGIPLTDQPASGDADQLTLDLHSDNEGR